MKRAPVITLLIIAACFLGACYQKGYTPEQEKEQLANAADIIREYFGNTGGLGNLNETDMDVVDELRDGDPHLYLTDWVIAKYFPNGEKTMYINTRTKDIYTDRDWNNVRIHARKLVNDLYGQDEDRILVDIRGVMELPYSISDGTFGNIELYDVLPADVHADDNYVEKLMYSDDLDFIYYLDVSEDVDMEIFKNHDTKTLGKDVRLIVRKYTDEAFAEKKLHPERIGSVDSEHMTDWYDSAEE